MAIYPGDRDTPYRGPGYVKPEEERMPAFSTATVADNKMAQVMQLLEKMGMTGEADSGPSDSEIAMLRSKIAPEQTNPLPGLLMAMTAGLFEKKGRRNMVGQQMTAPVVAKQAKQKADRRSVDVYDYQNAMTQKNARGTAAASAKSTMASEMVKDIMKGPTYPKTFEALSVQNLIKSAGQLKVPMNEIFKTKAALSKAGQKETLDSLWIDALQSGNLKEADTIYQLMSGKKNAGDTVEHSGNIYQYNMSSDTYDKFLGPSTSGTSKLGDTDKKAYSQANTTFNNLTKKWKISVPMLLIGQGSGFGKAGNAIAAMPTTDSEGNSDQEAIADKQTMLDMLERMRGISNASFNRFLGLPEDLPNPAFRSVELGAQWRSKDGNVYEYTGDQNDPWIVVNEEVE